MSVIFWIVLAIFAVIAVLALVANPQPKGLASVAIVAALATGALATSLPYWQISVVVIVLMALLIVPVFVKNTAKMQKIVARSAIAVLVLALVGGTAAMLRSPESAKPMSMSVMEGGNPASYPISDVAETQQVNDAVRLMSGEADAIPPITFYAYEAEPGTNNMGPAISLASAQDGVHRMGTKMVADPLYAATIIEFRRYAGAMNQEVAHQRARGYMKNRQAQMKDSQALLAEIDSVYLADFGATQYESLGMIQKSNPKEMPTLTRFSNQPSMEQTLVVRFKDGTGMYLRVACDLQPSLKTGFKGVPTPPTPEKPPKVPPTTYTPPAPPSGGAPPPDKPKPPTSTSQVPPSTTVTTTRTTETTTKTTPPSTTATTTRTTETTTKTSTSPSTTVPTTTPEEECPPEHPDCKDEDGGPPPADGHTGAPAPSGEPETSLPEEPNPIDPDVPEDAPAPGIPAPSATNVPTAPRPTEELPDPVDPAPAPSDPGVGSSDPDGQPAAAQQMSTASAPAAAAQVPAPVVQEPAPVQAAPVAEPQASAPIAPAQESPAQPAPAPAEAAESAPPVIEVEQTEVAPMSFNEQDTPTKGIVLLLLLVTVGLTARVLVRQH